MTIKTYEDAMAAMQERIQELHKTARQLVERHHAAVRHGETTRPGWENRSCLMLSCSLKGHSLRLEWLRSKWYGKKGERKLWREAIKKPKGEDAYHLGKLLAIAKDWEKPLVEEIEPKLAGIRHEARLLNKAMIYLRHARNAAHGKPHQKGVDYEDDME